VVPAPWAYDGTGKVGIAVKKTILLVEDEAVTALGLEKLLLGWGYDVLGPCLSGEEALGMTEYKRPDLALLDVRLASMMSGLYLAMRLREKYGVSTVFLTGQNTEEVRQVARRAQAVAFLVKPVADQDLRKTIESALETHPRFDPGPALD